MTDTPKPLTANHIRVLKTLCEKHPQSDLARAIATIEQQAEQIERMRRALELILRLYEEVQTAELPPHTVRVTPPWVAQAREALASTEPVNDKR